MLKGAKTGKTRLQRLSCYFYVIASSCSSDYLVVAEKARRRLCFTCGAYTEKLLLDGFGAIFAYNTTTLVFTSVFL